LKKDIKGNKGRIRKGENKGKRKMNGK